MVSRLNLHEELCETLGSKSVYFQPPASVQMKYPGIRYSLSGIDHKRANDGIYKNTNRYEVIAIVYDPDSDIVEKMLQRFPMCSFDRFYAADNLNHYVFTIYY